MTPGFGIVLAPSARPRGAWLLLLVLAFWAAQMHGFAHGVSHLGQSHVAPHAELCADCVASASAGAAPTPAAGAVVSAAPPAMPAGPAPVALRTAAAPLAYRSRAPPLTA